jgi:hypothetical protein
METPTYRPHSFRLDVDRSDGRWATCGCGWTGTRMAGANGFQAAIDQYAGHLRSIREAARQGITRPYPTPTVQENKA